MVDLPTEIKKWCQDKHSIIDKEVSGTPRLKSRVAVAEDDNDHPGQTNEATVRLKAPIVWQLLSIQVLSLAGVVEADIGDAHYDVVDDAAGGDEAD